MLFRVLKNLIASRASPVEGEVLRHARAFLNDTQHEQAIEILAALLEYRPDCVEGLVLRGTAKHQAGRPQDALADLERATKLAPDDPGGLSELAATRHALGDNRLALEYCERARRLAPDLTAPFELLARIKLGGEFYFSVLERVFGQLRPRSYVEVGVFRGESLRLARPPTIAIGIDPEPRLSEPPAANHEVFAETSDEFFANRDLRTLLGGLPVDLAFIDGMHHFEFALRDFANIERHCTRDSTILIHDCYPLDRESAGREPRMANWSGDIWRLIALLKKYGPELAIYTNGTPPTGLGLVRRLDPGSRVRFECYERLRAEFLALDYSYLDEDMAEKLNLLPNDWERIRAVLTRD